MGTMIECEDMLENSKTSLPGVSVVLPDGDNNVDTVAFGTVVTVIISIDDIR